MALPGKRHTILIVEDDAAILNLVQKILEKGNYEVLCANSAVEGERMGKEFPRPIHLLLADVIMPHMIGPDLATRLKADRPDMRVILMSGYPDGALPVLNGGWQFIRKPFVPKSLLEKIESVLTSTTAENFANETEKAAK